MTSKTEVPQTLVGPLLQIFFMEHMCSHKRLSPQTVKSYRDTFRLLLQYLQAKMTKKPTALLIADLDAPVILSFLESLEQQRHNQHAQLRKERFVDMQVSVITLAHCQYKTPMENGCHSPQSAALFVTVLVGLEQGR